MESGGVSAAMKIYKHLLTLNDCLKWLTC